MNLKKRILIAPLNWGLGHATRCIPVIKELISCGFEPVIASDGNALLLLQKEFPELLSIQLPAYNIRYPKKGKYLKLRLLTESLKLLNVIKTEKKATKEIVKTHNISGIISDNRFGVYDENVPLVFITHQLRVLSGMTTWLSTKMHQKIIRNFNVCWIPDTDAELNLSGKLGHVDSCNLPIKYIGPLSRLEKKDVSIKNNILVLLSGPEPQRTLLEEILLSELKNYKGKVVFVKGIMENAQKVEHIENMTVYNFMTSNLLEKTLNESDLVISRSGYTTIMDLAKLNKKAFFIPTPGQFEQEYLAKRLTRLNLMPSCKQSEFTLDKLKNVETYNGLKNVNFDVDFKELFGLFEGE